MGSLFRSQAEREAQATAERNEAAARAQLEGGPAFDPTQPKKSFCGELIRILDHYGKTPAEVEWILQAEQTRRRADAVKAIFDTALKGRSLGSLTSPGLVAKVVAENRDAIIEALQ